MREDCHKPYRRRGFAGTALRALDVIDHGEIGRAGAFGDLNPDGRDGRVVGEN
jgi:hypothetical protein